jgi:adhesin/invasin
MGIAPGSLITIYGSNLASGSGVGSTTPLPTELFGASVTINGTPVPLLFASSGQINAQVPFEIPAGPATLVVRSGREMSAPKPFDVRAAAPGVFTLEGGKHAVALSALDWGLNSESHPASPGQYIVLYLTGQGMVDGGVTGMPAEARGFSPPRGGIEARIGGRAAIVVYGGLAPGFVGLYQVNLLAPEVAPGEQMLEILIDGVAANPTVVSIGPNN